MGQMVGVVERKSTIPGVVRFELNRSLSGMGHERFASVVDAIGNKPSAALARQLFATGKVDSVHVYGNIVTVDVAKGLKSKVAVATASDAAAKALADQAKPILAMAAKSPEVQAMGLAAAVGRVNISTNKTMLNVAFDLTDAELTTLKNMLKMFLPSGP